MIIAEKTISVQLVVIIRSLIARGFTESGMQPGGTGGTGWVSTGIVAQVTQERQGGRFQRTEAKYERSKSGSDIQTTKHGSYTSIKAEVVETLPLGEFHPLHLSGG